MLMKTGILYFKTCFHGFGILRHVDPFCKDATHMDYICQHVAYILNYVIKSPPPPRPSHLHLTGTSMIPMLYTLSWCQPGDCQVLVAPMRATNHKASLAPL